jgi:hypothetical protein
MPYGISENQSDCSNWAAVKIESDGSATTLDCYPTKQDAIDRMVAQSLAEGLEPAGEVRAVDVEGVIDSCPAATQDISVNLKNRLNAVQVANYGPMNPELSNEEFWIAKGDLFKTTPEIAKQSLCANCAAFIQTSEMLSCIEKGLDSGAEASAIVRKANLGYCEIFDFKCAGERTCDAWVVGGAITDADIQELEVDEVLEPDEVVEDSEYRAINLSAPAFMRASAKRGLALHAEGLSGDGLVPQTVEDARNMAEGTVTEAKWRKISAWIARHIVDLDAVQGDEITAGLVAMLLWGGGSSKSSARRAQAYAEGIVEKLDNKE